MNDILNDIVSDSGKQEIDSDVMKQIQILAEEQVKLEADLIEAEKEVARINRELRKVREEKLPEALLSVGMTSFTLEDGSTISCGKVYQAYISEAGRPAAHSWLRENGFEDLIKNEIKVNFGRGKDTDAAVLKETLDNQGYTYSEKEAVHAGTLKAFVKEQTENGKQIPSDLFNIHLCTVSKVTRRK